MVLLQAEYHGFGITVSPVELMTTQPVTDAISAVLYNKSFMVNVKCYDKLLSQTCILQHGCALL